MILSEEKVCNKIVEWLRNYLKQSNKEIYILNQGNNSNYYLLKYLCKLNNIPTIYLQEIGNVFENNVDYYSEKHNGIIIGTHSKTENTLFRFHYKYDFADILPLIDLYKLELQQLLIYLSTQLPKEISVVEANATTKLMPVVDLIKFDNATCGNKLGITVSELEWADRLNIQNSIITSDQEPTKTNNFFGYTSRQKEIICKLNQREKLTRHKDISHLPKCEIRNIEGLVK